MKKFRIILILVEIALIIAILITIDYSNLISRPNLGSLFGIVSALLVILVLILSNRDEAREDKRRSFSSEDKICL